MSIEFKKQVHADVTTLGSDGSGKLPKVIWVYWDQGFDNAPDLVKVCAESWRRYNEGWEVILLNQTNVKDYFDINSVLDANRADIKIQHVSDLIRINLLAKYGGVWADATCLCRKPLDEWLHDYMQFGFFAFRNHVKDRILSNWFLAATSDSHLVEHFTKAHNQLWSGNVFSNQNTRLGKNLVKILSKRFNKNTKRTRWWLSPLLIKYLKIYPYPIFHYHFEVVVFSDEMSKNIWQSSRKYPTKIPHIVQKIGPLTTVTSQAIDRLKEIDAPVYKLDWRLPYTTGSNVTLLDYVLSDVTLES